MTRIAKLSIATLSAFVIIGCGGGTSGGGTSDGGTSSDSVNAIEGNIHDRLDYIFMATKLVSGTNQKACHKMNSGHGNTIKWDIFEHDMTIIYEEYSNENCIGDVIDVSYAEYQPIDTRETNGGKAMEVEFQFSSGDDLTDKIPNHILGYDVDSVVYTTFVSAGTYEADNLV